MLLRPFLACLVVATILVLAEYLWFKKILNGEYARKFIHILAGCFVASMPFWIGYGWIIVFALGAITLSIINHYHHLFKAGQSVARRSHGDLLLAFSILFCASFQPNRWIFMAAILHVSLADGFAAVVGTYFKRRPNRTYKVLNHKKSIFGTAAFMAISFLILAITIKYSGAYEGVKYLWLLLVGLPIVAAIVENVGIYGLDNLFLPILVLFSLLAFKL
jgi:dolichol kinase